MAPESSVATKRNPQLVALIHDLKKRAQEHQAPVWRDVANRLAGPTRRQVAVNLSELQRNLHDRDIAVVPGKVLASGNISKPVTVAAFGFSAGAKAKLEQAGGKALSISELAQQNPSGAKVRIIG